MQALILDDCPSRQTTLSVALMTRGFHVLNAQSNAVATAFARRGSLDVLIMAERVQGALTHSVALSAERHSPYVATILLTPRSDDDLAELHDLLPSLYSILGADMAVDLIGELALAGVTGATRYSGDRLLLMPGGNHVDTAPRKAPPQYPALPRSKDPRIMVDEKLFDEWVFSSAHRRAAPVPLEASA